MLRIITFNKNSESVLPFPPYSHFYFFHFFYSTRAFDIHRLVLDFRRAAKRAATDLALIADTFQALVQISEANAAQLAKQNLENQNVYNGSVSVAAMSS